MMEYGETSSIFGDGRSDVEVDRFDVDGWTPLLRAVEQDDLAGVQTLLRRGADPTRPSRDYHDIPLSVAIRKRSPAIAKVLLDAGRVVALKSPRIPLAEDDQDSLRENDLATLDDLLRRGMDPNSEWPGYPEFSVFSRALLRSESLAVCALFQWGADRDALVSAQGGWNWPPLHVAAEQGLDDIVWLLLLDGADPNRVAEKWSALFLAAGRRLPSTAELLLDAGARVDLGLGSETPLMAAANAGNLATVTLLLARGANVNAVTASGITALHHAARSGHIDVARTLLDADAERLRRSNDGYNATDYAANEYDPVYAQIYRDLGIPDKYSPEAVDDDWQPSEDFDFFLSYRHGRFAQAAADLAVHLKELNLRVFLDQFELKLDRTPAVSRAVLKSRLVKAVQRSRTLVFFESYLDSGAERTDEDGFYSFKWQFFELLHAREALLVSIDNGWCAKFIAVPGRRVETSSTIFAFDDRQDLARKLARRAWESR